MTHSRRRLVLAATLLTLATLWTTVPACAGEATDQVRLDVARVFDTLGGQRGRPSPDALRHATVDVFDWNEMARRMLGQHWEDRTDDERAEFVRLFSGLVQTRIVALGTVARDSIQYVGESVAQDSAVVETRIPRGPGHELALDYLLLHRDGRWRVYDVIVNHASLLGHYRAQFRKILRTASYPGLVAKLRGR